MVSVQGRKSQQKGVLNRVVHLMVARGRGKERQTERQKQGSEASYNSSDLFPTVRIHLLCFHNLPK